MDPVRIGLLAASRIAHPAIVEPAETLDTAEVVAVAARDPRRADEAAESWQLSTAYGSYEALLGDVDIDAIYIATPASLHRAWATAALAAGKHVLCEKPLAANADDARRLHATASAHPELVAMEAFHWRYHPFTDAWLGAITEIGPVERIDASFTVEANRIARDDIRWQLALGGGATMDLGCYPIQWVRAALGEPTIIDAEAVCPVEGVDGALRAELAWEHATGSIESSMIADSGGHHASISVRGRHGELSIVNPLAPHRGASFTMTVNGTSTTTTYEPDSASSTYYFQLAAFCDAIAHRTDYPTTFADGVANMEVVDACYRAADLAPRPTDTGPPSGGRPAG